MGGVTLGGGGFTGDDQVELNKRIEETRSRPRIDYTKSDPDATKDSMGNRIEYGAPVDSKGRFIAPNIDLPDEEYQAQKKAYHKWKSDYMSRNPSATFNPDGSAISPFKPFGSGTYGRVFSKGGKASAKKNSSW